MLIKGKKVELALRRKKYCKHSVVYETDSPKFGMNLYVPNKVLAKLGEKEPEVIKVTIEKMES